MNRTGTQLFFSFRRPLNTTDRYDHSFNKVRCRCGQRTGATRAHWTAAVIGPDMVRQ